MFVIFRLFVAQVMMDLKSSGLYENSVVLVTTDNGGGEGPFNANRHEGQLVIKVATLFLLTLSSKLGHFYIQMFFPSSILLDQTKLFHTSRN